MTSAVAFREDPIFSIVFTKGMAERHRLPLSHVLATLTEIDKMIREVGIQIQRAAGVERADGDFGVELLAGDKGIAFGKGSVRTQAVITRDVKNGVQTLGKIIEITDTVERKKVQSVDAYGEPVLRRLKQVGKIQEQDKTVMALHLVSGRGKPREANFSEVGAQVIRELQSSELAIESVTLYGKLKRLTDYSDGDEGRHFWGELKEDSGREWRIRFKNDDLPRVHKMFTKQVIVTGDATYFKVKKPRINVRSIQEEKRRDYGAALARFQKNYSGVFRNSNPQDILSDIRG
jgi:hypothetical protein